MLCFGFEFNLGPSRTGIFDQFNFDMNPIHLARNLNPVCVEKNQQEKNEHTLFSKFYVKHYKKLSLAISHCLPNDKELAEKSKQGGSVKNNARANYKTKSACIE